MLCRAVQQSGQQSSEHRDDDFSGIMASMAKLICRGMCNFKKYIMIKGFDYQRARSLGTRTLTGSSAAAIQQGQQEQK